jgi:hypothetical protein
METLSGKPLLRRVLATLPAWYSDEDEARLDAEAAEQGHVRVRRHSFEEMVAEMRGNPHAYVPDGEATRPMDDGEVQRCLDWLAAQGWVETVDEAYRMTQAGFEELHRPEAAAENVVPGPVELDLQPAVAVPDADLGVSADA